MMKLPSATAPTAKIMIFLRPKRSATKPKTTPPSGRATNPTAKTASAFNVDASGLSEGKNAAPR